MIQTTSCPYTIVDLLDAVDFIIDDITMLRKYADDLEEVGMATLPIRSVLASLEKIKDIKNCIDPNTKGNDGN